MRSIDHPGPVHPTRVQALPATARAVDIELPSGVTLLQGLADVVRTHGSASAVFRFRSGTLAPMAFVMPALSNTPEHVAYFSERFRARGEAQIESGSITFGLRDGEPSLHCHAIWVESDGQRRSGHLLPAESQVQAPAKLEGWMLHGAGFEAQADVETNFRLFQVTATATVKHAGGSPALVVRVRPNQDLCLALERLCLEHGIRRARIVGGVGSLIGAVFDDGRVVEPFVTEAFIRSGVIETDTEGELRANADVGLVAHTGQIAEGRLARGQNPVLITFELVIEILDDAPVIAPSGSLGLLASFLGVALVTAACGSGPSAANSDDPARTPASPQYVTDEGVYRNAPNPAVQASQGSVRIWTRFFLQPKQGTVPVDPIPVQPLTRAQLDALPNDANHLVRLGHSSHLLKLRGRYWLIDPVFGERVSPFSFIGPKRFHAPPLQLEDLPPIEGLILSHDHYDHLDLHTIAYLRDKVQRYFVPLGVAVRLKDMGVGGTRIGEFDWWQSAEHAGVKLTAAPSQHFSGRTLWDRNSTLWASWVIETAGQRIFYSGDSGYFGGFARIGERFGGFDLALIENGAYDDYWPAVHMTPEESVRAAQDLRTRVLYSVHNSTFDLAFHTWQDPLERIAAVASQMKIELATPVIGEVMTIGQPRENRLWWRGLR